MKTFSVLALLIVLVLGTSCSGSKKESSTTTAVTSKKITTGTKSSDKTTTTKKTASTTKAKLVTQAEFENKMADIAKDGLAEEFGIESAQAFGACVGKESYLLVSQQAIDIIMAYKTTDDFDMIEEQLNSADDKIFEESSGKCEYLIQGE